MAGNYSCVPSYSTPDWVMVRVTPRPSDETDLHHPGVIIEKQPASLLEPGVKQHQDEGQGEDLRWI